MEVMSQLSSAICLTISEMYTLTTTTTGVMKLITLIGTSILRGLLNVTLGNLNKKFLSVCSRFATEILLSVPIIAARCPKLKIQRRTLHISKIIFTHRIFQPVLQNQAMNHMRKILLMLLRPKHRTIKTTPHVSLKSSSFSHSNEGLNKCFLATSGKRGDGSFTELSEERNKN